MQARKNTVGPRTSFRCQVAPGARWLQVASGPRWLRVPGLGGEGTMTITSDSTPFAGVAALKGYRFGKVDDTFEGTQVTMNVPETDAAGKTQATAAIDELKETSLPLKADINIAIFEPGGRTTSDQVSLPVRTRETTS